MRMFRSIERRLVRVARANLKACDFHNVKLLGLSLDQLREVERRYEKMGRLLAEAETRSEVNLAMARIARTVAKPPAK